MNKKELTAQVASKTGLTGVNALKAIDAVFQTIQENLERNEPTVLQGFGSFSVVNRAERMGINPSTREIMKIAAHKVVKFTVSKSVSIK